MTLTGTLLLDFNSVAFRKQIAPHTSLLKDRFPRVALPVKFPRAFTTPPTLLLGISGMKAGGDAFEFTLEPANITETGFLIQISGRRSWIDTLHISWLATDA